MLITQAAGRAGRANLQGKVIVQAYNVEANAVVLGSHQDYETFCRKELIYRKKFFYPPYCRLVKLMFMSTVESDAKKFAKKIVDAFKTEIANNSHVRQEILGPIPAMISKYRDEFRFVVLIKTKDLSAVRKFLLSHDLDKLPEVSIDIDPISTT